MSKAFLYMGDEQRADVTKIEALWGPIERFSLTDRTTAAATVWDKLPSEAIFTDILQYAPAEIPNLRTLRGRDLLYRAAPVGPPAPAPELGQ